MRGGARPSGWPGVWPRPARCGRPDPDLALESVVRRGEATEGKGHYIDYPILQGTWDATAGNGHWTI